MSLATFLLHELLADYRLTKQSDDNIKNQLAVLLQDDVGLLEELNIHLDDQQNFRVHLTGDEHNWAK